MSLKLCVCTHVPAHVCMCVRECPHACVSPRVHAGTCAHVWMSACVLTRMCAWAGRRGFWESTRGCLWAGALVGLTQLLHTLDLFSFF